MITSVRFRSSSFVRSLVSGARLVRDWTYRAVTIAEKRATCFHRNIDPRSISNSIFTEKRRLTKINNVSSVPRHWPMIGSTLFMCERKRALHALALVAEV